jgi:hypothetical protein
LSAIVPIVPDRSRIVPRVRLIHRSHAPLLKGRERSWITDGPCEGGDRSRAGGAPGRALSKPGIGSAISATATPNDPRCHAVATGDTEVGATGGSPVAKRKKAQQNGRSGLTSNSPRRVFAHLATFGGANVHPTVGAAAVCVSPNNSGRRPRCSSAAPSPRKRAAGPARLPEVTPVAKTRSRGQCLDGDPMKQVLSYSACIRILGTSRTTVLAAFRAAGGSADRWQSGDREAMAAAMTRAEDRLEHPGMRQRGRAVQRDRPRAAPKRHRPSRGSQAPQSTSTP